MTTAPDQELAEEDDLGSTDPLAVAREDTQPPSYRHVRRFRTTATFGVRPAASCFDCRIPAAFGWCSVCVGAVGGEEQDPGDEQERGE